jgi:hypothetical protein
MLIVLFCLCKKVPKKHSAAADGLGFCASVASALVILLCAEHLQHADDFESCLSNSLVQRNTSGVAVVPAPA